MTNEEKTEPKKKKIVNPADMPAEAYTYWHERWVGYLNEHYKELFVREGLAGHSFTERCPDAPDGKGYFTYAFAADGTMRFAEEIEEGDAVIEYDSYNIGYRAFGDEGFDSIKAFQDGTLRLTKSPELQMKTGHDDVLQAFRGALHAAIADAERKFNIELPKYW